MMLLLLIFSLAIAGVFSVPTILPGFQQVKYPGPAVVRFVFPKPLVDCRVRVSSHLNYRFQSDEVLDFSLGAASAPVTLGDDRLTASFAGLGLASRECGISIQLKTIYRLALLVECFGRSEGEGWDRGSALVTSTRLPVLASIVITPRLIVAAPGTDVSVLWKSREALTACFLETRAEGEVYMSHRNLIPASSRYRPNGLGLVYGQCGATMTNVSARDAGMWWWSGYHGNSEALQSTVVLVASAPRGKPVLRVRNASPLGLGDVLEATCHAPPGVPAPKLTWLLDGQVVRQDDNNDTLPGDVAKAFPWEPQGAVQTFTWRLSAQDFGKRLECQAKHWGGQDVVDHVLTAVTSTVPKWKSPTVNAAVCTSLGNALAQAGCTALPNAGCPALASASMLVHCSLADKDVDCSVGPVPLGTTASLECRQGSKPQEDHHGALRTTCSDKGWRPRPLACSLDCGFRRQGVSPLISKGIEAFETEFPWHVAVFTKQGDFFEPTCGGSLINRYFFVSAAHCYWSESAGRPNDPSLYHVAVGKHSLSWETRDKDEQQLQVKAIHIPPNYAGSSKSYEADIALIQLSASVIIKPEVNVVCMDWASRTEYQQLAIGSIGTVPGWGLTEENTPSPTLRYVDLPFIPYLTCRDTVPQNFQNNLVADKMCGGYGSRPIGVCHGDSGGGFVFPARRLVGTRYFLRGVVSTTPKQSGAVASQCGREYVSAYTKVSLYAKWMEDIVLADMDGDD